MKLKRADKDKQKEIIRNFKTSGGDFMAYRYAWEGLAYDHYQKLMLDLKHIGDIPILDMLRGDTKEDAFITRNYIKYYSPNEKQMLRGRLKEAKQAISYLERILNEQWQGGKA